ncbi:MAG TPA: acyl carrier protein [Burkholderiaceae bacterium]|nr:acyl carrier protein [Burkholderiaceae bacterium]
MSSTLSDLLALIQEKFDIDPAQVDPEKPLEEYGLDSLSKAELLFAIEDHFGFEYPEQYTAVNTLQALAEVVTRLRTPAVA